MDQVEIGYAMVAGLLGLLALGIPIGMSMLVVGALGLLAVRGFRGSEFVFESFWYSTTANLALIVIPLFVFMGHLAFSAGLSEKAYRAAKAWVGHVTGGLSIATVFACAGFATVCGSSVATAATVARITVPEMLKAGYDQRISGGSVAAAGALGVLIPPSGILVIYSVATNVPIADLFVGALVPGLLTAIVYAAGIHLWVRRQPAMVERTVMPRATWRERARATLDAWEMLVLFLVVIGSIYLGFATPTEAAAVGAGLALLFALAKRNRPRGSIRDGLVQTGASTASIFLLIVGSSLFSVAFATTQVPTIIAGAVAGMDLPPTALLFLLLLPYLFLGCFIDGISMIFLTMPVVFPIVQQAGIDPVLFGIVVTKMTEIGAVTPPVGLNVYVVQGAVPELRVTEIFRGVIHFIVLDFLVIALIIMVPQLVTGLIR